MPYKPCSSFLLVDDVFGISCINVISLKLDHQAFTFYQKFRILINDTNTLKNSLSVTQLHCDQPGRRLIRGTQGKCKAILIIAQLLSFGSKDTIMERIACHEDASPDKVTWRIR